MNHKAKKKFGQNFLQDSSVIERIIHAVQAQKTDYIIEIGPGLGALSKILVTQCQQLSVVEIDNDLIPELERQFSHFPKKKWHIFHQDALKFSLSQAKQQLNVNAKFRIIGNLPYNISTPLLFHFIEQISDIEDMHFMLQKEVVERICARPDSKDYGRLSIMLQYFCECEHLFNVSPESFDPIPKVDSAIVRLKPYDTPPDICEDSSQLSKLVSMAFAQRRKTLRNNFKKAGIEEFLQEAQIDSQSRAENISLAQYVKLCNILTREGISF